MFVVVNNHNKYKSTHLYTLLMDIGELVEIGLTRNQAKFYLSLLKFPGQTAGELAKRISTDRSFAYDILNSLRDKGLVSYVKKENQRVFFASDPENLLKDLDEKRNKIHGLIERLNSIKPQKKEELSVNVYEGKAGLKAYVMDFLETEKFYTMGGGDALSLFEKLKYQYPQYLMKLTTKRIAGKIITSEESRTFLKQIYKDSKVKIKSFANLKSPVSFTIFKDKIAIYSAEEKPFVIIIEDKNISTALKAYFDILWNINSK